MSMLLAVDFYGKLKSFNLCVALGSFSVCKQLKSFNLCVALGSFSVCKQVENIRKHLVNFVGCRKVCVSGK